MSAVTYTEEFMVPYYLCDREREVRLTNFMSRIISVSSNQTEALFGDELNNYMKENNYSWIILQCEMDIDRLPKAGETVQIETKAEGYTKLFCYRRFNIYDESGTQIVSALITYAWLNIKKRRMARLNLEYMEAYGAPFEDRSRRLPEPKAPDQESLITRQFDVFYGDIDINDHVNNTVYFNWAIESLGIPFQADYRLTHLNVKYGKEIREGEPVTVLTSKHETENYLETRHTINTEEKRHSQVEMRWEAR